MTADDAFAWCLVSFLGGGLTVLIIFAALFALEDKKESE